VGSFPVKAGNKTIAIISLRVNTALGLHEDNLVSYAKELESYAVLMSVARNASRNLVHHAGASVKQSLQKVYGKKGWKSNTWLTVVGVLLLWLFFGTMPYSLTVPCSVTAADPREVSSPREGILQSLEVVPGHRVKKGQLLASIDVEREILEQARLRAELTRIAALLDRALAESDPAGGKVLRAQREATLAELDMVKQLIERSKIRAPQDGIVLAGDLRRKVGSKLSLGEPLFQIATDDFVVVELKIPEHQIADGRESLVAVFAPHARPYDRIPLRGLSVAPSSTVIDGKNVFLAESKRIDRDQLSPGMEGVAYLEVGERSVWWIMTHRITDWMYLQFWM
jgi:multidrug efflux pump subunit AcrA (membrane-fusion protein)